MWCRKKWVMDLLGPVLTSIQICHTSLWQFSSPGFLGSSVATMVHYPKGKLCFQLLCWNYRLGYSNYNLPRAFPSVVIMIILTSYGFGHHVSVDEMEAVNVKVSGLVRSRIVNGNRSHVQDSQVTAQHSAWCRTHSLNTWLDEWLIPISA